MQAPSQTVGTGWSTGVRAGVAAGPNQFLIGATFESPGLTPAGHVTFRPNGEIGIFGGVTELEGNLDVVYWATLPKSSWTIFFGGGPGAAFATETGTHHTGGIVSAVVGFESTRGLSLELRAGGGTGHSLELVAGYFFKKG